MDQTQALLNEVVHSARVGLDACEQLMQHTSDADLRKELMTEREQYQAFIRDGEQTLFALGGEPHAQSAVKRAGMWMGIQFNTMTDDSAEHICEILIQGLTMGLIEITKQRTAYPDASAEAQGIASNFLVTQRDAIDRLLAALAGSAR